MKIENLPENPTAGVVRRTLRGMDGRIKHVETLVARWSPKRIDDAIAAALAPVLAQLKALTEEFAAFKAAMVAPDVTDADLDAMVDAKIAKDETDAADMVEAVEAERDEAS